jgi:hypothetical protein
LDKKLLSIDEKIEQLQQVKRLIAEFKAEVVETDC